MTHPAEFDAERVRALLAGKRIGHPLHCLATVDSTNRAAWALAREGAPEGTMVIADRQTAGRGRLERVWQSPPGCNLYASIVLRPPIPAAETPRITLAAGVAVAEALLPLCPAGVNLKWPNDVRIGEKKVCGILAERKTAGAAVALVVGIGVNVNIVRADFDPAFRESATSLLEETGRIHSREELAVALCGRFEKWYKTLLCEGFPPVRERWLSLSGMAGKRVRLLFRGEEREGLVAGIDGDGALLLSDERGDIRRVTAGDARILK